MAKFERVWVKIKGSNPVRFKRGWRKIKPKPTAKKRGKLAIAAARSDIGYAEKPAGSNMQKYGAHWDENGVAWCGLAVAYWWAAAGFGVSKDLALKIDYVPELVALAAAKKHHLSLVHRKRVRAGDAVAFDFDGGASDHVGLFERWVDKGAGVFQTIEGNTAVGNDAAGGRVMRRTRYMSQVAAFVRKIPS
jgi:hypothetical protein